MLVKFKVLKGPVVGKEIKLPVPKCLIGRGEGCHIRPQNDAISRRHCVIVITDKEVVARDLNSRNGTIVNGQRITEEVVLLNGDTLAVGPLEFEVMIEHTASKVKRPAMLDLKDVLARTAQSNPAQGSSTTMDLGNITSWLDEADAVAKAQRMADPDTRNFKLEETDPGKQPIIAKTGDTDIKKPETLAEAPDDKKPEKKEAGKLPIRPSIQSKDSREAATESLKKFFNRR